MHLQNTADAFLFVLGRVQYIGTRFQCTGIDSEESQLTDERICHDLESQC